MRAGLWQAEAAAEYVEHELELTLDLLSFTLVEPGAPTVSAASSAAPTSLDSDDAVTKLLRAAGAEPAATASDPAEAVAGGEAAAAVHDFARLSLLGFQVVLAKRPVGIRSEGSLHTVEMLDLASPPGALGHALVRPAPAAPSDEAVAPAASASASGRRHLALISLPPPAPCLRLAHAFPSSHHRRRWRPRRPAHPSPRTHALPVPRHDLRPTSR